MKDIPYIWRLDNLKIAPLIILFVLFCLNCSDQSTKTQVSESNNNYYTATDELLCAGAKIKSVVRCPLNHNSPLWQLECKQELFVKNNRLLNLSGNTTSWACIKDKKNSNHYFVIDFFSGGNCWVCESTSVYDLDGNLIITDYLDYNDSKKCNKKKSKDIKTPEGFVDEFAARGCSQEAIEDREKSRQQIESLKHNNGNEFKGINFEKELQLPNKK